MTDTDLTSLHGGEHSANGGGGGGGGPSGGAENESRNKRKKASRACGHCQKAHLTCDDSRPCSRCVKRELAATCADGVRKKAKYLLDVDEEVLAQQAGSSSPSGYPHHTHSPPDISAPDPTSPAALETTLIPFPLAPNFNFGSKTVNLEYSFLSNMLGAPPIVDNGQPSPFQINADLNQMGLNAIDPSQAASHPQPHLHQQQQQPQQHEGEDMFGAVPRRESMATSNSPLNTPEQVYKDARAEIVYKSVMHPYDYREGFHSLVRYVKERMEKPDIMRICRALAQFRPSFMAQIMNLSEEDLVFMEKCFQRTLMEFDKLIGSSGTPTVVWRRTGEIALVGKEFSILTSWPREQLLGKKTYIYELMDNSSAVEYWEKFSLIAFDNSQQSVMTTATLVGPSGRPVPCAFCFTIKRDIFDVPLAIVGNFLPL
ncbi:transcription activator of gluconeogenesis ERT1 [Phlyctochytrium arcticum]|nr:transcription activator of gluconeogenesis ERT1 [Phlyctochytrium arcticum]